MKKMILPSLMETYRLVKFWNFDNERNSAPVKRDKKKHKNSLAQKQQMRAVSSPSLHHSSLETIEMEQSTKLKPANANCSTKVNTKNSSNAKRPNSYPTLNVLQKFKRTLASLTNRSDVLNPLETAIFPNDRQQAYRTSTLTSTSCSEIETPSTETSTTTITAAVVTINGSSTATATTTRNNSFSNGDHRLMKEICTIDHNKNSDENGKVGKVCNVSTCGGIQIRLENCDEKNLPEMDLDNLVRKEEHQNNIDLAITQDNNTFPAKAFGMNRKDFLLANPPKSYQSNHELEPPESLPVRSISHPQFLQAFGKDKTESECDSYGMTYQDEGINFYPAFVRVIHNFTAVGPHELGLERGALVEVLSKQPGPWWFGRIKREETGFVKDILDPELGWFPKDFVQSTQFSEIDDFYPTQPIQISQSGHEIHQSSLCQNTEILMTTTKHLEDDDDVPSLPTTKETKFSDRNNVTTIVIEPQSLPTRTSSSSSASESALASTSTAAAELRSNDEDKTCVSSTSILRLSAVKELLTTEINYVKLLASICEGFLPAMTKHIDIFSPNSIRIIFSNIAAVYSFQRDFLHQLRKGIEQDQIAKVFLKMHKGFLCYSTYCNSYPRALIELGTYQRIKEANIVLENCRESENLTEFPLAAHLLSPVQRICRYPLHLSEILKMTVQNTINDTLTDNEIKDKLEQLERLDDANKIDLPDTRKTVEMALEAMRGITEAVNEGKRHSETIARYQAIFQNFKGPPLHLHSIRFFLQIDATRQKQNLWNSSYTLFLFDNQLIYCKRDIIKRSQFIYKGRIFIDRCRVVNIRDGKMFGQTIKNALRIYCEVREKWYDFCFRSANRKQKFLHTLALERQFGGKALYVSEMTGFDYALRERTTGMGNMMASADFSDQSDYELCDTDYRCSGGSGDYGDSSQPDSPSKLLMIRSNVTLPKKSKSRDFIGGGGSGGGQDQEVNHDTGSLGRRRIGNWFRKPKSSNSTPNLSPTHKPLITIPLLTQSKELQLGVINRLGNPNENTAPPRSAEV